MLEKCACCWHCLTVCKDVINRRQLHQPPNVKLFLWALSLALNYTKHMRCTSMTPLCVCALFVFLVEFSVSVWVSYVYVGAISVEISLSSFYPPGEVITGRKDIGLKDNTKSKRDDNNLIKIRSQPNSIEIFMKIGIAFVAILYEFCGPHQW